LKIFATTSPSVSSTPAQTKAEVKLAIWNDQYGMWKMPATSGAGAQWPEEAADEDRQHAPALHEGFALGNSSGCATGAARYATLARA
jgi:hypothetical protein